MKEQPKLCKHGLLEGTCGYCKGLKCSEYSGCGRGAFRVREASEFANMGVKWSGYSADGRRYFRSRTGKAA